MHIFREGSDTDSLTLKNVQPGDFCPVMCELRPEIIPYVGFIVSG